MKKIIIKIFVLREEYKTGRNIGFKIEKWGQKSYLIYIL